MLKTTNIYYLTWGLRGTECRNGLADWFGSRVCQVSGKLLAGRQSFQGLTVAEQLTAKLIHVAVVKSQFFAGFWPETSLPCHMGLS